MIVGITGIGIGRRVGRRLRPIDAPEGAADLAFRIKGGVDIEVNLAALDGIDDRRRAAKGAARRDIPNVFTGARAQLGVVGPIVGIVAAAGLVFFLIALKSPFPLNQGSFGSNRDQNDVAPQICLGSAVIEMPHAFVAVAKSVKENTFKPEFIELNTANGNIGVHWNAALKAKIPAPLMKKINDAQAQIKSGKLKIKRNV